MLRCPDDAAPLAVGPEVRCAACGREFGGVGEILRMLPSRDADPDVRAERAQRDREARRYDRLLGLRVLSLAEIPLTLRPLRLGPETRLLEVGCGTGRISVPAARSGAACVFLDHSLESLRVLHEKLPASARVLIVQGDASCLPIRDGWATTVLSSQMLEHLPGDALRERAIREMARVLAPKGRLALSAYRHLPFLPRDGKHSGEIGFHRFTQEELRRLLDPHFRVERLTGALLYVYLAHATRAAQLDS